MKEVASPIFCNVKFFNSNLSYNTPTAVYTAAETPPSNSALFLISSNSAKYSAPSNKLFELRKIDYKNFPIFALAFIKLQDEDEVSKVLNMDFNKYIEV